MSDRDERAYAAPAAKPLQSAGHTALPLRDGSRVIVEAEDRTEATEVFWDIASGIKRPDIRTAKLAPSLFFAQAQPTGRYWSFKSRIAAHSNCH